MTTKAANDVRIAFVEADIPVYFAVGLVVLGGTPRDICNMSGDGIFWERVSRWVMIVHIKKFRRQTKYWRSRKLPLGGMAKIIMVSISKDHGDTGTFPSRRAGRRGAVLKTPDRLE